MKNINVYNFIRGLSPYPGAYSELVSPEGTKIFIKIYKSSLVNELLKHARSYSFVWLTKFNSVNSLL